MNIVFMGTPDFAVPSLEILLKNNYHVATVVTAPDKPRGRGQQMSFTPVKEFALKHSLPLLQPESLGDASFTSALKACNPDLFVVVAFRILPPQAFSIPAKGAFNLHASLLPKYRGAAPINWAIINGEKESGVTTFFLREKVDTGNIILQARVAIPETMTAGELHDTLSEVGAEIVLQTVRLIEMGKAVPRAQDDALVSPAPKIFKDDCRISWSTPAVSIHNFIRGLSPHPTAWTTHGGMLLKIFRSERVGGSRETLDVSGEKSIANGLKPVAGIVKIVNGKLCVATGDGAVAILEIQQEGKKRMAAEEFLRGYRLRDGDRFE
jgi:methionyl-tRNA formyltransferase